MVRGKKKLDRSLTMGERQDLQGQKQEIEATIRSIEESPGSNRGQGINVSNLKKQSAYLDGVLHEGTPKKMAGTVKDGLIKRAGVLREEMQVNMPTRFEMDHPAKSPGAIAKHIKWSEKNDPKIREYREIMRKVEPDDPTATDVEQLRRDK